MLSEEDREELVCFPNGAQCEPTAVTTAGTRWRGIQTWKS